MTKKKVTVLIEEEDYLKLRSKLVLQGKNFATWLREVIRKIINEQ